MYVMNSIFFAPAAKLIFSREEQVETDKSEAAKLEAEIAEKSSQVENDAILAKARAEAVKVINSAADEARSIKEKEVNAISEQIKNRLEETNLAVEAEIATTLKDLEAPVQEIAKQIKDSVIGVTAETREELKV